MGNHVTIRTGSFACRCWCERTIALGANSGRGCNRPWYWNRTPDGGDRRQPPSHDRAIDAHPAHLQPHLRQLHLRQPQLGPVPARARVTSSITDLLQVRHHLDAEHPAPPDLSRRPAAGGVGGLALARPQQRRPRRHDRRPRGARRTGASSRATCRSTACPTTRRCDTSSSCVTPRDVFMSFWNHYSSYTDEHLARLNGPGLDGPPMPRCPDDIHAFWPRWIGRGWFPWESEGWPHSGNLHHTATWWRFRHLPNILFVHYADLLADLPGEIGRVADFVGIPARRRPPRRDRGAVSFDALRRDPDAGPMAEERARTRLARRPRHLLLQGHQRPLARRADRGRTRAVRGGATRAACHPTAPPTSKAGVPPGPRRALPNRPAAPSLSGHGEAPARPAPSADALAAAAAQRRAPRPAAGAPLEPAVLRRPRHAHRPRRHLVLPRHPDRPQAAGQALLLDPEARGRPLLPRHPGREGRHHRRRRPLRRRRLHRRGRRRATSA